MTNFRLNLDIVRPIQAVTLPPPWAALEESGFHPDLLRRARGYMMKMVRDGHEEVAKYILTVLGEGFMYDEKATLPLQFPLSAHDQYLEVKTKALQALEDLRRTFGSRVSRVQWESLACLAVRNDPYEMRSIISIQAELPHHYAVVDCSLHAIGKVFGLMAHVQTQLSQNAGTMLEHNCDCNHSLVSLAHWGHSIKAPLPEDRFVEATNALFSHQLSEFALIAVLKLPFEMGVSSEAEEIIRFENAMRV